MDVLWQIEDVIFLELEVFFGVGERWQITWGCYKMDVGKGEVEIWLDICTTARDLVTLTA